MLSDELLSVLRVLPDPAVVFDPAGRFIYLNPEWAKRFGGVGAATGGGGPADFVAGFELLDARGQPFPPERHPGRVALEGAEPEPVRVVVRRRDTGEERAGLLVATPLKDAEGRVRFVFAQLQDAPPARGQRVLEEAGPALLASLEPGALGQALAHLVVPALADLCEVDVREGDGTTVHEVAHADPGQEALAAGLVRAGLSLAPPSLRALALRSDAPKTLSLGDVAAYAAGFPEAHAEVARALAPREVLCVPLRVQGRPAGTLTLGRVRQAAFDAEDVAVAVALAHRASLALEKARLHREVREALERKSREAQVNEVLHRLGVSFASELEPAQLAQTLVEEAGSLVESQFAAFFPAAGGPTPFAGAPEAEAAREALATCVARLPAEGATVLRVDNACGPAVRSLLAVRIVSRGGEEQGRLCFGHPRPGYFREEHERAVASVATQVAVAMDNARLFAAFRDTQQQLRRSEERLRLSLAAGQMGYFDWDLPTQRVVASPRVEQLCGVEPGTFGGAAELFLKTIHPEDWPHVEAWIGRVLASDNAGSVEYRVVHPDGTVRWLEASCTALPDAEGRPVRILGVAFDVTDRRRAGEEMRRLMDELVRSNGELERFAYVASHDLQEPLRMVTNYAQLLARRYRGRLDADADDFLHFIVDGAVRMRRLITDLLAYSRVTTQGRPLVPVETQAVLARVRANLEASILDAGAELTWEPLPPVLGDETQLEQVLQNLVANALKFRSDAPTRVHVLAERRGAEWLFSVRDNGIGISPEHFDRIFVIFQRLHTAAEYPGTGLGLAICKKVVERHGGRIWVESSPGQGATFFFTLPAVPADPPAKID